MDWHSYAMFVIMPKSARDCSTLFFIAIGFRRVILPKNNLDSVKNAPSTDLKSINFVEVWHLSLNVLIFGKGRIHSVDSFQSVALYWLSRIHSKVGTRVYASILSLDFRFTCHIKLVFWTQQNKIFQYSLSRFGVEIALCYWLLLNFFCCKSSIKFSFINNDV